MPLQVENARLTPSTPAKIITLDSTAAHGFCDILISNSSGVDATVVAYISGAATPGDRDIVVPSVFLPPFTRMSLSCMLVKPSEALWVTTEASEISVRATILGAVTSN